MRTLSLQVRQMPQQYFWSLTRLLRTGRLEMRLSRIGGGGLGSPIQTQLEYGGRAWAGGCLGTSENIMTLEMSLEAMLLHVRLCRV